MIAAVFDTPASPSAAFTHVQRVSAAYGLPVVAITTLFLAGPPRLHVSCLEEYRQQLAELLSGDCYGCRITVVLAKE